MLKNDLPKLAKKLSKVYRKPLRIRGPYLCKDGRKRVDIAPINSNVGVKSCLLARVRLEIKIGRKLRKGETVDHKDEDKTNDSYANVQLLTLEANAAKSADAKRLIAYQRSVKGRLHNSLRNMGDRNNRSKISNKLALKARRYFVRTGNFEFLLNKLPLKGRALMACLSGNTYKEASGPLVRFLPKPKGRPVNGDVHCLEYIVL